jgi:hypothetical protein
MVQRRAFELLGVSHRFGYAWSVLQPAIDANVQVAAGVGRSPRVSCGLAEPASRCGAWVPNALPP